VRRTVGTGDVEESEYTKWTLLEERRRRANAAQCSEVHPVALCAACTHKKQMSGEPRGMCSRKKGCVWEEKERIGYSKAGHSWGNLWSGVRVGGVGDGMGIALSSQ